MENKISHHNIKYYFVDTKIIYYKFYSHFKTACGYVAFILKHRNRLIKQRKESVLSPHYLKNRWNMDE